MKEEQPGPSMSTNIGGARAAGRLLRVIWQAFVTAASVGTVLVAPAAFAASYEVVQVTNGGTVDGVVTLAGQPPALAPIKVTKNQDYCGATIANPVYAVGKNGALQNVVVYLKDVTKGKALSGETIALVNDKCMFSARVQGASVGQQIKISSNDPILHNTHPQNNDTNRTIYNIALPFKGFSVTKPLPATPQLIRVKCDAHEWMRAWIWEFDHPYFATTGDDGHFTIRDVPPGTYTLVAWHEAAGEKSVSVQVPAGQSVTTHLELAAK